MQAFHNEASYGKVSFSGRVVGWIDLGPQTTSADTITQTYNSYAEQATAYATFSDYDIVYFIFLTDASDEVQMGWQMQNTIDTSQGRAIVGIDFMINSQFFTPAGNPYLYSVILPSRSWAHELLHTLGSYGHDTPASGRSPTGSAMAGMGSVTAAFGERLVGAWSPVQ